MLLWPWATVGRPRHNPGKPATRHQIPDNKSSKLRLGTRSPPPKRELSTLKHPPWGRWWFDLHELVVFNRWNCGSRPRMGICANIMLTAIALVLKSWRGVGVGQSIPKRAILILKILPGTIIYWRYVGEWVGGKKLTKRSWTWFLYDSTDRPE